MFVAVLSGKTEPGAIGRRGQSLDGLELVAVADAERLVGRFDRELVSAARIALLVVIQALEADIERRIRLRFLAAGDGHASARPAGEADRAAVWIGPFVGFLAFAGEFLVDGVVAAGRCELARLWAAGADTRHRACTRRSSCRRRQGDDGQRKHCKQRKLGSPSWSHSLPQMESNWRRPFCPSHRPVICVYANADAGKSM